ncbi:MAG: type VII toxin-antitoxin system MntA family adenylyltransferase antitoxin [Sulfuricaulis sp.]
MSPAADPREKLLANIVAQLRAACSDVIVVYRFGTWATAAERVDSDLDLAVLTRQRLAAAQSWEIAQQLAMLAGCNVDLVDLQAASTVMAAQIISQGERLYCSDARRCAEFEDYIYSAYAHLNEERRDILRDIKERGSVYG